MIALIDHRLVFLRLSVHWGKFLISSSGTDKNAISFDNMRGTDTVGCLSVLLLMLSLLLLLLFHVLLELIFVVVFLCQSPVSRLLRAFTCF